MVYFFFFCSLVCPSAPPSLVGPTHIAGSAVGYEVAIPLRRGPCIMICLLKETVWMCGLDVILC